MKKLLIIILILIAIIAIAWHRLAHGDSVVDKTKKLAYCPTISEIQKNPIKQSWYAHTANGFWKSYNISFATNVTQFIGSEWKGENLGKLVCYYKSIQNLVLENNPTSQPTLPVVLVYHSLIFVPEGSKWLHNKRGERICKSTEQKDCPFTILAKPKIGNIYQIAESLKYEKSDRIPTPIN